MSKSPPIRVGLIGAGYVSEFHVMGLRRLPNVRLIGICDLDQERATAAAAKAGVPAFATTAELYAAGIDAVHVLTPPQSHATVAIQALEHGCDVLIEKPLATSTLDCDRIAAAARRAGKRVAVNHSLLFDPFILRALQAVRNGAVGEIISVDYFRSSEYPPYRGGPLPPQYREGGYPFRDLGVHGLYLIQAFLGDIQDVQASFRDLGGSGQVSGVRFQDKPKSQDDSRLDPPDTRNLKPETSPRKRDPNLLYDEWRAVVQCARGTGQMQISWNVRPIQHQLFIQGTAGTLRLDLFSLFQTQRRNTPLPKSIERAWNAMAEGRQISLQVPRNVARFLRKKILPYHGLQDLIAAFYANRAEESVDRRPQTTDVANATESPKSRVQSLKSKVPSLPSIADARPIVEWTEKVAREADSAKETFRLQFPQELTAPILVTGGTGFIGRHLVERLLAEGHHIRLLVRRVPEFPGAGKIANPKSQIQNQIELVLGDLGDPEAVDRAVSGTQLVYHLGAAMSGSGADFERGTVVGTRNLLQSIANHRTAKLVYVSSLSVLHAAVVKPNQPITEQWPLEPAAERRGFYSQTKLEAERLVREAATKDRNLQIVIVRPGQVFGPGLPLLVPAIARRRDNRLIFLGDGNVILPLVYVEDVVDALMLAAKQMDRQNPERAAAEAPIYHLVDTDVRISQNDIARLAKQPDDVMVHLPRPLVYALATSVEILGKILGRAVPLSRYRIKSSLAPWRFDCSAARDKLGWKPRVGVAEGIRRTLGAEGPRLR